MASTIKDTKIHFFAMKVDSAIIFMLLDAKSQLTPSFVWLMVSAYPDITITREEVLYSINGVHLTANPLR